MDDRGEEDRNVDKGIEAHRVHRSGDHVGGHRYGLAGRFEQESPDW